MQDDKQDLTSFTLAQLVALATTIGRTRSMACADAIEAAGAQIREGADHRKSTLYAFAEVLRTSEVGRFQAMRDVRRELLRRAA